MVLDAMIKDSSQRYPYQVNTDTRYSIDSFSYYFYYYVYLYLYLYLYLFLYLD